MKKEYSTPEFDLVEIEVEDAILNGSIAANNDSGKSNISSYTSESLW